MGTSDGFLEHLESGPLYFVIGCIYVSTDNISFVHFACIGIERRFDHLVSAVLRVLKCIYYVLEQGEVERKLSN